MSSDFNLNWGRVLLSVIAPADSLHGQLQRGRGRGYLSALREDVAEVRPLLLDCLLHDPRWDRQLEPRSDYYAQLAMRTALPLDPLQAYLHERTQIEPADPNDLVQHTLRSGRPRLYTGYRDSKRLSVLRGVLGHRV